MFGKGSGFWHVQTVAGQNVNLQKIVAHSSGDFKNVPDGFSAIDSQPLSFLLLQGG